MMKKFYTLFLFAILCAGCDRQPTPVEDETPPRIVNIINFIRQNEPRIDHITEEVLYQTVVEQVAQLKRHELKGTFLLQYDALIDPLYTELLKNEVYPGTEIGGWWEITEPHVKAAGMEWRGRFPWDWHADVGFSTGYTPAEREKLVDVYMEKFKEIFGYYPASVGSWFIDAHTLGYLYDKYGIVASCNCKDQIGTDGYTLWGGYWNQAYYPSRKNAYMPAQTEAGQIPVPVFRMLGSDPSYQYDGGIGKNVWQDVITLEPLNGSAGSNPEWVDWFFHSMFDEPCLAFSYVQAGQENMFTWEKFGKGLEMQVEKLSAFSAAGKIRVETLGESGEWFRKNFPVTPPTAITSLEDYRPQQRKTVWYNSRYYRTNLLWEGSEFKIRDIHLFDENYESEYLKQPLRSSKCVYTTLPFVDGNLWSDENYLAGIKLYVAANGLPRTEAIGTAVPQVTENGNELTVAWEIENVKSTLTLVFQENRTMIACSSELPDFDWELRLTTATGMEVPFTWLSGQTITADHDGFDYQVQLAAGTVEDHRNASSGDVFSLLPEDGKVILVYGPQ